MFTIYYLKFLKREPSKRASLPLSLSHTLDLIGVTATNNDGAPEFPLLKKVRGRMKYTNKYSVVLPKSQTKGRFRLIILIKS